MSRPLDGNRGVVLVTTKGRGSMDRYGQELAARLPVRALELDVATASAGTFNVRSLSGASVRTIVADAAVIRALRRANGLRHLTNHHLARYGAFIDGPYVVTAHDIIRYFDLKGLGSPFINRPNARDRALLRVEYAGLAAASAVIAVSDTTKRDLIEHLGIPADRVYVVYEGVDHARFRPVERRIVDPPYVLFVGSEHPRKNLAAVLRAFARVKCEPGLAALRLVKVGAPGGREGPFRENTLAVVRALGIERDVIFTGEVPDDDLPAYYSGASCLVLPSRYEGFGLPPIEAMACGCPVVVSTCGSLPEIAGGAALVVDPDDVDRLAGAIRALVTDSTARAELRARGLVRARAFSWERTAEETLRVYEAIVGGRRQETDARRSLGRGRLRVGRLGVGARS